MANQGLASRFGEIWRRDPDSISGFRLQLSASGFNLRLEASAGGSRAGVFVSRGVAHAQTDIAASWLPTIWRRIVGFWVMRVTCWRSSTAVDPRVTPINAHVKWKRKRRWKASREERPKE